MIPKKIHYCWFGGKELPEDTKKYIESWKKYCPDYEIIEWNEKNFDLSLNEYVKEAYECKKWAFVSDVARLYALCEYGGIYMDTDVEVLKNLDDFLKYKAFSGFEDEKNIPTGIMACEKDFGLFREFLDDYKERHFINSDGSFDITTNVEAMTRILLPKGLKQNNTKQVIEGFVLYPKDYFCPKSHRTGKIELTNNTYTIHHFNGSWEDERIREKRKVIQSINRFLPYKIAVILGTIINEVRFSGVRGTLRKIVRKN